jgi:hypothetical protein
MCNKSNLHSSDTEAQTNISHQPSQKSQNTLRGFEGRGVEESPSVSRDPSRAHLLHRLTSEWDALSKDLSGEELLKKQKEFALKAVGELGAGPELLEFLGRC